jgi:flagellar biosynthesis activator protein FlaF
MSSQGYTAYKTAQKKSDDPRDVEYSLLAQVTAALRTARTSTEIKTKVDAVLWNRDVWSALRQDLVDESNQLPKQLRASLISVSLWIEKETHAVMDGAGDIDALIDINRNIMAGLKPEFALEDAETLS